MIHINLIKPGGTEYHVFLLKHKCADKWQFVNMTKGHICPCEFNSVTDAIADLHGRFERGEIIRYAIEVAK